MTNAPTPLRERIKRVGPGRYQVQSDRATGRSYAVQVNGEQGARICDTCAEELEAA